MKRCKSLILTIVLSIAMMISLLPASRAEAVSNQMIVYRYLTEAMKLSPAAACGVMANIQYESSFNPNCLGDNGTSYGICQWHNIRYTRLKEYCAAKGLDYTKLESQMIYLEYELKSEYASLLRTLREVSNDPQGAYDAGYHWCYDFERPANKDLKSVTRGNTARDYYWPNYSGVPADTTTPASLSEQNIPGYFMQGSGYSFKGTVESQSMLTNVTATFKRPNGAQVLSVSLDPHSFTCDLSKLSAKLSGGAMGAGVYTFELSAANASGVSRLIQRQVHILGTADPFPSQNVTITSAAGNGYALAVGGTATPLITTKTDSKNAKFQLISRGLGCYAIRSIASGEYLTLLSNGNVVMYEWRGVKGQYWYLCQTTPGNYSLVPKNHPNLTLTVKDSVKNGAQMTSRANTLSKTQIFRINKIDDKTRITDPVITHTTSLSLPKTGFIRAYGAGTIALNAKSNGKISYKSTNTKVAEVSSSGLVKVKNTGLAYIVVTAKRDKYQAKTIKVPVYVRPVKQKITSLKASGKGKLALSWNKDAQADGYEVQVTYYQNFDRKRTYSITSNRTDSKLMGNLRSGRRCKVRVRAYKKIGSKKLLGRWSAVKTAVTK